MIMKTKEKDRKMLKWIRESPESDEFSCKANRIKENNGRL